MLRPAQIRPLPLPRSWPRRVRSAVVQVISLGRTSLALTQGVTSKCMKVTPFGVVFSILLHRPNRRTQFRWTVHQTCSTSLTYLDAAQERHGCRSLR